MLAGFPKMFKNYREHARGFSKAGWRIPKGVGSMARSVFEFELIVFLS